MRSARTQAPFLALPMREALAREVSAAAALAAEARGIAEAGGGGDAGARSAADWRRLARDLRVSGGGRRA